MELTVLEECTCSVHKSFYDDQKSHSCCVFEFESRCICSKTVASQLWTDVCVFMFH